MDNLYLAWWNLENLFDTEHLASRSFPPGSRAGRRDAGASVSVLQPAEILRGKLGADGFARQTRAGSARAGGTTPRCSPTPTVLGFPGRICPGWRNRGSLPIMFDQFLVSRGLLTGKRGLKINTESVEVVGSVDDDQERHPPTLRPPDVGTRHDRRE